MPALDSSVKAVIVYSVDANRLLKADSKGS